MKVWRFTGAFFTEIPGRGGWRFLMVIKACIAHHSMGQAALFAEQSWNGPSLERIDVRVPDLDLEADPKFDVPEPGWARYDIVNHCWVLMEHQQHSQDTLEFLDGDL